MGAVPVQVPDVLDTAVPTAKRPPVPLIDGATVFTGGSGTTYAEEVTAALSVSRAFADLTENV
jgi:hypothetical protein